MGLLQRLPYFFILTILSFRVLQVGVPVPAPYPVAVPKPVAVPVAHPVPVPYLKSVVGHYSSPLVHDFHGAGISKYGW